MINESVFCEKHIDEQQIKTSMEIKFFKLIVEIIEKTGAFRRL